jgi:UDP-N-acetylmuramate dehydrogenase
MLIQKDFQLKDYNTFGLRVRADYFSEVNTSIDLKNIIESHEFRNNKSIIMGEGSNILFTEDFSGFVIYMNLRGMRMVEIDEDFVVMEASAGENWHNFVDICLKNRYYGLENLALIPGKVGAAPVQNIGAYGVEQKDYFHSLTGIDMRTGEIRHYAADECGFGYRSSIFKKHLRDRFIITEVRYRLPKQSSLNLSYHELDREVRKFVVVEPDARYVFETVCRLRRRKLPDINAFPNAGSFFKNPVIDIQKYNEIKKDHPRIIAFEDEPGKMKISAGWLIDDCGWKGKSIGDAAVFEKHALVLINKGNATGKEILQLANEIIESVDRKFDIRLQPEVRIV